MKRFILFLTLILFSLCFPIENISVNADFVRGNYLRVINDTTPFYKNLYDQDPLFYLPYTYYVKILDEQGDYLHVECFGNKTSPTIDGYVPKVELFDDSLLVVDPYLNLSVTTSSTTPFFLDSKLSTQIQYIFKDRTLSYYGKYEYNGKIIYYVGYNNKLGYVEENNLYPFVINNHPNELTFLTPSPPIIDDETNNEGSLNEQNFSIKVAIILCLIFAGIIALFFALKKSENKEKRPEFYDQNDFE